VRYPVEFGNAIGQARRIGDALPQGIHGDEPGLEFAELAGQAGDAVVDEGGLVFETLIERVLQDGIEWRRMRRAVGLPLRPAPGSDPQGANPGKSLENLGVRMLQAK